MDFGVHEGPGTNPLWILRDDCTHFVLDSVVGTRNVELNQIGMVTEPRAGRHPM